MRAAGYVGIVARCLVCGRAWTSMPESRVCPQCGGRVRGFGMNGRPGDEEMVVKMADRAPNTSGERLVEIIRQHESYRDRLYYVGGFEAVEDLLAMLADAARLCTCGGTGTQEVVLVRAEGGMYRRPRACERCAGVYAGLVGRLERPES